MGLIGQIADLVSGGVVGDGVGQVDQHGIQQPSGLQLHFDDVFGTVVEVSQSQQPLNDGYPCCPTGMGD